MTRLTKIARSILPAAVALATLIVVGWAGWRVAGFLWAYLAAVPKEMGVALVAAAATVFVSTLTVMLGRYFERKRELDALYRDKKVEIYDEFLQRFFALLHGAGGAQAQSDEVVAFLRDFMRKLLLWSGPEPITAFVKWKEHLARGVPDAQTIFLTEAFLIALRKDLRHSNRGIPKGFFAHLFLKEGALFLAAARTNPKITLAELSALEQALQSTPRADGS